MKLKSLLFTSFAVMAMSATAQETVLFDFSKPSNLDKMVFVPQTLAELKSGKYMNESTDPAKEKDRFYVSSKNIVLVISGDTFTLDGVTIEMTNPDKYKDYPRFFIGNKTSTTPKAPSDYTDENFYADMRWYQTQIVNITAPAGKYISKIVMNAESDGCPARANNQTEVVTEGGVQTFGGADNKTLNTWIANEGTEATSVTYKAVSGSATQMAYSVEVTLADLGAGVSEIMGAQNDMPAIYYNLQGAQVANLENGIFIRRQGNKVEKVVLRK